MSSFFSFFPSTLFNDKVATNVIAKVRFKESVLKNAALFYPYNVEDNERPDQIAERYYGDARYDWVVYMSNNIVDPYYDWPRSDDEINKLLIDKYSTLQNAQRMVSHYAVNYDTDDRVVSTAAYDSFSAGIKKYWAPILGYNDQVINYQRKVLDHYVETNRVISLTGTFSGLTLDQYITFGGATGFVSFASATNVIIRHTTGSWTTGASSFGTISNVTTIVENIPIDEEDYWMPVTVYERVHKENEDKKTIQLLAPNYIDLIEHDMKELLSS